MMGNVTVGRSGLSALAAVLLLNGAATSPGGERQWASEVLAAARGAPVILCGLAARAVEARYGNGPWTPPLPSGDTSQALTWALERDRSSASDSVLLDGLAADDPCVRSIAARLVARSESPSVTAGLIRSLAGPAAGTRAAAAVALGLTGIAAGVDPLIARLRDTDADVRTASAWALGGLDDARAVAPLSRTLGDAAPAVRAAVAQSLGRLDDSTAVRALAAALRDDSDERVRSAAAEALGMIGSRAAIPALADAIGDRSPAVRRVVVWALGHLDDSDVIPALTRALGDADRDVREMATWGLGQSGSRDAVPVLGRRLADDAEPLIRERAAWALGQIGDRAAVEPLGAALRTDRSSRVRSNAAWALGQIGEAAALPALSAALTDSASDVRGQAAWAIGQIGTDHAPAGLTAALKDPSSDVRQRAAWALGRIADATTATGAAGCGARCRPRRGARRAVGALANGRRRGAGGVRGGAEERGSGDARRRGPGTGPGAGESLAVAHPPADAAPVPVRWGRVVLASVLGLAGASAGIQSPGVPFGLRAGRHDVGARVIAGGHGRTTSIWYPARCGRRPANPATPCRDAPPDSGRFPLVALVVTDRARTAADTATAAYLASHGYVVSLESDTALVDTAWTARVEPRPSGALLRATTAGRRLSVDVPAGSSDHVRVSAALTHAFLDAAFRGGSTSLDDLARRLRATGLVVRLSAVPR